MKETKVCHTPEYLSKDILNENFVNIFKIFHRFQYFIGTCRVDVKDRFVTAPTFYQKIYTIFCIFLTLVSNVLLQQLLREVSHDIIILQVITLIVWYGFIHSVCIVINGRFINGQSNADFLIHMQKVDRIIGLDKVQEMNVILKFVFDTSLFSVLLAFFIIFLVSCSNMNVVYLTYTGTMYSQMVGIVELTYCLNIMGFFFSRVRFINSIIKNHLTRNNKTNKKKKRFKLSKRNVQKIAAESHNFITSDTHIYMKELFDLFTMFQNLFRFQLFTFCLKLVFGCLFDFGIILFSIQRNSVDVMVIMSVVILTIIDIFIAIFIGVRLHMIFAEVKENKRLSIAVMAEYSTGPLREKARKMLKMADETPPRLSIYDMYDMDAGIFLSIFSLITSLIVTLLQFAFL